MALILIFTAVDESNLGIDGSGLTHLVAQMRMLDHPISCTTELPFFSDPTVQTTTMVDMAFIS